MPTPAQLKAVIDADKALSALARDGRDADVAAALNDPEGPGSGDVSLASVPRDDFLAAILPAAVALADKDDATQRKWDRLIGLARAADNVRLAAVRGLVGGAVKDGLLTAEYAAAIGVRRGSMAEVLWGAGTVITAEQAGAAR